MNKRQLWVARDDWHGGSYYVYDREPTKEDWYTGLGWTEYTRRIEKQVFEPLTGIHLKPGQYQKFNCGVTGDVWELV